MPNSNGAQPRVPTNQKITATPTVTNTDDTIANTNTTPSNTGVLPPTNNLAPTKNLNPTDITNTLKLDIQPNIMDNYDQPSYFITWSLIPDIDGTNDEIIIAQTGTTVINIQELIFENIIAADFRSKNYNCSKMTMKLFEPMAANLTQKILAAAEELAVDNYMASPWKLEVSLQALDSKSGDPMKNIGGGTWSWTVKVSEITSVVNETGSIHTVKMFAFHETAFLNGNVLIPGAAQIAGDTVGTILKGVIDSMNTENARMYGYQHIQYKIEDRTYASSKINDNTTGVARPFDHQTKGMAYKSSTRNSEGVQLGTGQDLPSLLDIILGNSITACKLAGVPLGGIDSNEPNTQSVMHRIEATTEITAYNPKINDYDKIITYVVVPHSSPRMISKIAEANQAVTPETSAKRIQKVIDQIGIHKAYDYTFTGLNTEVYKFDTTANFNWFVNMSLMMGNINIGVASVGRLPGSRSEILLTEQKINAMKNDLAATQATINTAASDQIRIAAQNKAASIQSSINAANDSVRANKAYKLSQRSQKSSYIDDLDDATLQARGFKYYPILVAQTPDTNNKGGNINETGPDHNIFAYSALLNQLYGNQTGDYMQDITVEIRGDPYWFGDSNTDSMNSGSTPTAIYGIGENVFLFRFNIPLGYDEDSGTVKLTPQNLFSGFYTCNQIEHRFRDGTLTQVLHGRRIPTADLSKLALDIKSLSNSPSPPTVST